MGRALVDVGGCPGGQFLGRCPGAAEAVRQSSQPEMSMKLFLSERGLMRFSAFDVPDLTRPGAEA